MPEPIEMTLKGVLIAGRWRRKDELPDYPADPEAKAKMMDGERNTLIVELGGHTNQGHTNYFQGFNNDELIGKAAVIIFLRDACNRDRKALEKMSDSEQRKLLIEEIHTQTDIPNVELQAINNQKLVELALQWSATSILTTKNATGDGTLANPFLIDAERKTPDPDDSHFVHITVHFNPNRELQFNTLDNQITKKVKISGVSLKWAKGNAYQKHMAYQGENVFDVKELEIYADQVIVSEPLRFPKTDVKIYARQLIFEGSGSINTTPMKFEQSARCPTRTSKGKDYPADKNGTATYIAADGKNGEKAGDVHLFVREIIDRKPGSKRIIAQGSKGQNAEDGGLKPYEPQEANQPSADKGKDLTPVTCKNVREYVEKVTVNHSVDTWRWPGEVSAPESIVMTDDALKQGKVVHCRLILFDDNVITANVRRTFLPGENTITSDGCHLLSPFVKVGCVRGELDKYEGHTDPGRKKPGNGETAYASGKPGNGGDGGKIISYLASAVIDNLCTVESGLPGEPSKTIDGGTPGQPFPAYWLEMRLVRREEGILNSVYKPTIALTPVKGSTGTKAEGKIGTSGNKGTVETRNNTSFLWVHPESLGTILNYARLAYRNGQRAKALAMLKPYFYALLIEQDTLSPVLLGQLNDIAAILANMKNNLDYYGNPPGWLPRLDVKTNYQIWHLFSQESSKLLYFAQKMEHEWDIFEDQQEAISQTTEAVKGEMNASVEQLSSAYTALGKAKDALEEVQKKFEAKQREVDRLRLQATEEAKKNIKEQQIFSGAMKLIGGLAEIIPVGQPYLGMAGKTIANVGDFDWNKPDTGAQFGKFFTKLGKQTDEFLENNEDLFIERSSAGIPKPEGSVTDLKTQIKEAKGSLEDLDDKVLKQRKALDTAIEQEWNTTKQAEADNIRQRIKDTQELIKTLAEDKKEQAQKDLTAFEKELAETVRLKLERSKDKLYEQLGELNKNVKDKAVEKIKQKQQFLEKVEALEKKKADLEAKTNKYETEKEACETKTKNLLTNLSGLGNGISQLGQGIAAITAPYDEKEVDKQAAAILEGSKFSAEYQTLLSEVKELNNQKANAVSIFCFQQQLINNYSSRISNALLELNALTSQRQVASALLDPIMKEYLRNMQNRAKENLLWSQYHFVKAWQYEYLQDVSDDFYNLDQWVERLREFERQKAGIGKKKLSELTEEDRLKIAKTFLSEDDFLEIGDKVRKDHSLELVKRLINDRQHHPRMKKASFVTLLSAQQCKDLAKSGSLRFNLIDDFNKGSYKDVQARISDITLEVFQIASDDNALSISVDFVHSGTSVLLGNKNKYYKFEKAPDDNPIVWGFVYNHSTYLRLKAEDDSDDIWSYSGKGPIKKNEDVSEPDNDVLEAEFDEKIKYKEYLPSFFSDITLCLNKGQSYDATKYKTFLAKLEKIEKVQFAIDVFFAG